MTTSPSTSENVSPNSTRTIRIELITFFFEDKKHEDSFAESKSQLVKGYSFFSGRKLALSFGAGSDNNGMVDKFSVEGKFHFQYGEIRDEHFLVNVARCS